MSKNKVIVPTKKEVATLLYVAKNDKTLHMETVGELLGMKWADLLMQ